MTTQAPARVANENPLLSKADAAAYLSVNERWLRRAVEEGELTPIKLRRCVRFQKKDLDDYIKRAKQSRRAS